VRDVSRVRLILTALLAPLLAAAATAIGLLRGGGVPLVVVAVLALVAWGVYLARLLRRMAEPLSVLTGVLAAFRDGDYSIRLGDRPARDALAPVFTEVNRLGERLRARRLDDIEAALLLQTIVSEMDVAILAFDEGRVVRLANPASALLLGRSQDQLTGRTADELGAADWLQGAVPRTVATTLPGGTGPWELRRRIFREQGRRHTLVVLADLGRALREEERQVWQRLIRVLGHELNNSLAPIRSIAVSLADMMNDDPLPADWRSELSDGLGVVASRAASLSRFVGSYARLAQLPPPKPAPMDVEAWIAKVAPIEIRCPVVVDKGPTVQLFADPDQLDQLLINLVRNAADAALGQNGSVTIRWNLLGDRLQVLVLDDGPGLSAEANLFVPFFTTKPGGSGIGLVLCRQIAEAHGGSLGLANRLDRRGCVATLTLPLAPRPAPGM
jgi:two-component system, NtrC family, nitrogen regulation sensor histidine kinase NtrY